MINKKGQRHKLINETLKYIFQRNEVYSQHRFQFQDMHSIMERKGVLKLTWSYPLNISLNELQPKLIKHMEYPTINS